VEFVAAEVDGGKTRSGYFHAFRIFVLIQFGPNPQTGFSGGCRDELDDGFEAAQGLASPIEGNKGKEAMFDFIPFTGAGWQVTHRNGNPQGIGQGLQFDFP
jgi:hypothetical protein